MFISLDSTSTTVDIMAENSTAFSTDEAKAKIVDTASNSTVPVLVQGAESGSVEGLIEHMEDVESYFSGMEEVDGEMAWWMGG
jgi:hypothetical protein